MNLKSSSSSDTPWFCSACVSLLLSQLLFPECLLYAGHLAVASCSRPRASFMGLYYFSARGIEIKLKILYEEKAINTDSGV